MHQKHPPANVAWAFPEAGEAARAAVATIIEIAINSPAAGAAM